jgi:hypothetical protein
MTSIRNEEVTQDLETGKPITPEEVARMPILVIKEGLRQLGLDPNEPLPERLKRLIAPTLEVVEMDEEEEEVMV